MNYNKESEITQLLERIEEVVEAGKPSFMSSNKVSVDRDEIREILQDIRLHLPTEINQAVWIVEERHKILMQAETEARQMIDEAQDKVQQMIQQHEVTNFAEERAEYILDNARESARQLHNQTVTYAADQFLAVEQDLNEKISVVEKDVKHTVEYLNKELESTIDAMNRAVKHSLDQMIEQMKAFDKGTKEILAEMYDNRHELEQTIQHAPLRKEN